MPLVKDSGDNGVNKIISDAVVKIALDIDANIILFITKDDTVNFLEDMFSLNVKCIIFKKDESNLFTRQEDYKAIILKSIDGSLVPIKEVLRELVVKRILNVGHKVVCATDDSIGAGYIGLIFIFEVDKVFFKISSHKLTENIDPIVLDSVLNLAIDIAKEGREGRPIGTAFILGDEKDILKHTRQMIFNPFAGYPIEQRKVQDPSLRETIKEFSQLDGVFIINKDGTIVTAGAYITLNDDEIELPAGLGTRHRSCAILTKHEEEVIAIVISESGGVIRIFKKGRIITKLSY